MSSHPLLPSLVVLELLVLGLLLYLAAVLRSLSKARARVLELEAVVKLRNAAPKREGRCRHLVETTALVGCDRPEGHDGPCACGELAAWRA